MFQQSNLNNHIPDFADGFELVDWPEDRTVAATLWDNLLEDGALCLFNRHMTIAVLVHKMSENDSVIGLTLLTPFTKNEAERMFPMSKENSFEFVTSVFNLHNFRFKSDDSIEEEMSEKQSRSSAVNIGGIHIGQALANPIDLATFLSRFSDDISE